MTAHFSLQLFFWLGALACLFLAVRLLRKKANLLPMLRGNLGVFSAVLAAMLISFAIDLSGYEEWQESEVVAEISFVEFGPGIYIGRLSREGRKDRSFELHGDQWLLDARSIGWQGLIDKIGLSTIHRFDRLSARHMRLSDDLGKDKYVYELGTSRFSIDTWKLLHKVQVVIPWMTPQYAPGITLPMAHNASYKISYQKNGLQVKPANSQATVAADDWL